MDCESNDEKALKNLIKLIDAAWNNSDARALSDLFEESGDFIFHNGLTLRGRTAIEKHYQGFFPLKREGEMHAIIDDHVRLLRPDIAIIDSIVELYSYSRNSHEKEIRRKLFCTMVAIKENRQWLISAIRLMLPKNID